MEKIPNFNQLWKKSQILPIGCGKKNLNFVCSFWKKNPKFCQSIVEKSQIQSIGCRREKPEFHQSNVRGGGQTWISPVWCAGKKSWILPVRCGIKKSWIFLLRCKKKSWILLIGYGGEGESLILSIVHEKQNFRIMSIVHEGKNYRISSIVLEGKKSNFISWTWGKLLNLVNYAVRKNYWSLSIGHGKKIQSFAKQLLEIAIFVKKLHNIANFFKHSQKLMVNFIKKLLFLLNKYRNWSQILE